MRSLKLLAFLVAFCLVLIATDVAHASTVLGTGTGSLIGGDLTDVGDDGVEGNYAPPTLGGFDAVFFASTKAAFGNREQYFNVFDNRVGSGDDKACCGGIPVIIGADFSTTQATGKLLIRLDRFTLASSNDSAGRDPDRWSIQGSTDTTTGLDGTWTDIYAKTAGGADWGSDRNEVIAYGSAYGDTFLSTAGFKAFRLNATESGGGTDFALGEMEFFGTIFVPTTPGDPLFWDGDTGNWTTADWLNDVPGTGASQATYPQNIADVVHPANITEGIVTVNSDEEAYTLTMDAGSNGSGGRPGNGTLDITSNTLAINNDALISGTSTVTIGSGATFNVSGTLTIDPGTTFTVDGDAIATTLAGTGTATFNAGSQLTTGGGSLGAVTLTGDAEVSVGGNLSIGQLTVSAGTTITKSGGGTLDVTGVTTLATGSVHNVTAGILEYSGSVGGSADLVKNGAGIMQLSNANTYTGITTVNDGVLSISNATALGATASGTVVNNGASLRLTGGGNFNVSEPLTLNGGGDALSDGALHSQGNNHDVNGPITLGSNATIRKDGGGDLEIRGGIDTAGHELRIEAANTIRILDSGLTGSGTLRKEENGTLEIRTNNTGYTGTVNIINGYVDVNNQVDPLGSGTINVSNDGTLRLRDGVTVSNSAINISTDGEGTAGAIRNENNTNTITGTVTSTNNASRIHLNSGQLNLEGPLALNNNVNIHGGGTLNVTGQVSGAGGLNKNDAGTTYLANAGNDFTGALNVNGGTVDASVVGSHGNPSDITVADGAMLILGGGAVNNLTVGGDVTTLANVTVNDGMKVRLGGGSTFASTTGAFVVGGPIDANNLETLVLGGTGSQLDVSTPAVPVGHPTSGLLGAWTFDDGTATDVSGNGHHGSLVGSPSFSSTDLFDTGVGMSLDTNGNNAVLIGGNEADFDTGDQLTVVAWVKERPDGGWEPYISKRGESNGWQVRRRGNDSNFTYTLRGTTGAADPTGSFDIGDNDGSAGWMHVVARYDGTTNKLRQVIVNGNTTTPDISITDTGDIGNTGSSVVFGARDNSNNAGNAANIGNYANIKLDDVFIYDRWLTDAEIATIYNSGKALSREFVSTAVVSNLQGSGEIDATSSAGLEVTNSLNIDQVDITGDLIVGDGMTYAWELGTTGNDVVDFSGGDDTLTFAGDWTLQLIDDGGESNATEKLYLFTGFETMDPDDPYGPITSNVTFDISQTPASWWTFTDPADLWIGRDDFGLYLTGLQTVPEPSTLLLMGLGVIGLLGYARRRRLS